MIGISFDGGIESASIPTRSGVNLDFIRAREFKMSLMRRARSFAERSSATRDLGWKLPVFGGMLVLVLAFQNCGGPGAGVSGSKAPEAGSPVTVINPVNPSADLQFVESKVAVAPVTHELLVKGRCSTQQEGSRPSWTLNDATGRLLFSGHTECRDGEFAVDLRPLGVLNCGEEVRVVARLGVKSPAELRLERRCQAEVVKTVESLKALLPAALGEQALNCSVEISRGADSCQHVCYDAEGRVAHATPLTGAICD